VHERCGRDQQTEKKKLRISTEGQHIWEEIDGKMDAHKSVCLLRRYATQHPVELVGPQCADQNGGRSIHQGQRSGSNVLSQPTEITRQATAIKSGDPITETRKLQLEFWTLFRKQLLERKVVVSAQTPRPQYWFDISLGRATSIFHVLLTPGIEGLECECSLGNKIAELALPQLEAKRAEIEAEIGEPSSGTLIPRSAIKLSCLIGQQILMIALNGAIIFPGWPSALLDLGRRSGPA
jgi:hypothetical protein